MTKPPDRQPVLSTVEPQGWRWFAILAGIALTVRLIVVWQLGQNNPGFHYPAVDSEWHYQWAKDLADGNWLGEGVFFRAPLYPYLLGIWIKLFGDGLWGIRIAQAALGAITTGLIGALGSHVFGRRVGITAGLIWACYGPAIYFESELLISVVAMPLTLGALLLAIRASGQDHRRWVWLAAGLLLGLSAIARPNILLAVPLFWWLAARPLSHFAATDSRWSRAIAVTIGLLLPIIPVTVRNAVVGGDFVLISYQSGVNLYAANNANADGLTLQMPELHLDESVGWNEFVRVTDSLASSIANRRLSPSEISSFWTGKAITAIADNPAAALGRLLTRCYYLFNGFEAGDQTDIYEFSKYSSVLSLLIRKGVIYLPFGLILPLAVVAIPVAWRNRSRGRPLIAFAALYLLTVIPFLALARYRLPVVMIAVILAAVGLWMCVRLVYRRDWSKAALAGGALIALIVILNRPTVERIMWNPAFNYYQQALIHDRRGEWYEAIELYERAIAESPGQIESRKRLARDLVRVGEADSAIATGLAYLAFRPDDADIKSVIGSAYLAMGDTVKARAAWRVAARESSGSAEASFHLGTMALDNGDVGEAIDRFREAVAADSGFAAASNALALIYGRGGNADAAADVLRASIRHAPAYSTTWANLGAVLIEGGHAAEAIEPLNEAIRRLPERTEIRYNLAVAYLRTGNAEDGRTTLEDLIRRSPGDARAADLLYKLDSAQQAAAGETPSSE